MAMFSPVFLRFPSFPVVQVPTLARYARSPGTSRSSRVDSRVLTYVFVSIFEIFVRIPKSSRVIMDSLLEPVIDTDMQQFCVKIMKRLDSQRRNEHFCDVIVEHSKTRIFELR